MVPITFHFAFTTPNTATFLKINRAADAGVCGLC